MAYVIKYNGNIVAGPFLSEYAAVQKRSKLFKEYGSTAISLSCRFPNMVEASGIIVDAK